MDTQIRRSFSDLSVGMTGAFTKSITDQDVRAFAQATGDRNPLHLDDAFAKTTIFKQRISHGILTAGLISATFAEVLPGPGWVYVNQFLEFRGPVHIDDQVTATVEVIELKLEKKFAVFRTVCRNPDRVVLEGEATLMAPPIA